MANNKQVTRAPNWKEWKHTPEVRVWQACALSLGIDPRSMQVSRYGWMGGPDNGPYFEPESFPSQDAEEEFGVRQRVLCANLSNREFFSPGVISMTTPGNQGVRLSEFSEWAVSEVGWENLPPELVAMAQKPKKPPTPKIKQWGLKQLTEEKAIEWLKKPCWSMMEALFLLNNISPDGANTTDSIPEFAEAFGADVDWLRRAVTAKLIVPVGIDKKSSEAAYVPLDVIRIAKNGGINNWLAWEKLIKNLDSDPTQAGAQAAPENTKANDDKASSAEKKWVLEARRIATEYIDQHKENNLFPTQADVCEKVAKKMRDNKIYGPQGTPLRPNYIQRNAIQGDWWKANKP